MKILIDPGHGGWDPGAVSGNLIEKVLNLKVALQLGKLLVSVGVEVFYTRTEDVFVSLDERCRIANDLGVDYVISIHHNAGGGDGAELIHSIYAGEGKALAEVIAQKFKAIGQNLRGVYSRQGTNGDYYAIIRQTLMPAIISEFAFLDSADSQIIDTDEELFQEANAAFDGFVEYLKINIPLPQHWAQADHDELRAAGLLLSDHSAQLDEPATEAMVISLINRLRKQMKG